MDGMFQELLKPVLLKIYPCALEEIRSSKQKEMRIIDTLEPLLNQHRMVFDKGLLLRDINHGLEDSMNLQYSLVYQLTHISKARGSLRHDDRLDALSMCAAALVELMGVSEDDAVKGYKEEMLDKVLEEWIDDNSDSKWFSLNKEVL